MTDSIDRAIIAATELLELLWQAKRLTVCRKCGEIFEATKSDNRSCSAKCRQKAYRDTERYRAMRRIQARARRRNES